MVSLKPKDYNRPYIIAWIFFAKRPSALTRPAFDHRSPCSNCYAILMHGTYTLSLPRHTVQLPVPPHFEQRVIAPLLPVRLHLEHFQCRRTPYILTSGNPFLVPA